MMHGIDTLRTVVFGLSAEEMGQYVHYVADQLLLSMGFSVLYGARNPVGGISRISPRQKPGD